MCKNTELIYDDLLKNMFHFIDNSLEKLFLFLFFCQQPRPPVCGVNSEIHVLDRKPDVLLIKGSFRFRIIIFWTLLSCHD